MRKYILAILIISVFCFSACSYGLEDDQAELTTRQQQLEELSKKITAKKEQIYQVRLEYIEGEKRIQREVAEKTCTMKEAEKEEAATKEIIQKARERQAQLRKDYYQKKEPLAEELYSLKTAYNQCLHEIKNIERRIRWAKEGKGSDYQYIEEMEVLRQELADLKAERDYALAKIKSETDEKLAVLSGDEQRTRARREIVSEAKAKELTAHQDYTKAKELIAAKIDKAKLAHRKRMAEKRTKRREEQMAQGKGPISNFGPSS